MSCIFFLFFFCLFLYRLMDFQLHTIGVFLQRKLARAGVNRDDYVYKKEKQKCFCKNKKLTFLSCI